MIQDANKREEEMPGQKPKTVLYLIWRNPYMTVNGGTLVSRLLDKANFENIFAEEKKPYPVLTRDMIKEARPDYVFLSSEPYPFREKHIAEVRFDFPTAKVILVDGELFSWYGTRMGKSTEYFEELYRILTKADQDI